MLTWWESNSSMSEPCSGGDCVDCWRFNAMAVPRVASPGQSSYLPINAPLTLACLRTCEDEISSYLEMRRPGGWREWGRGRGGGGGRGRWARLWPSRQRDSDWLRAGSVHCTGQDLHHHHHTINNRQQAPHCHTVPTRHCKHKCGVKDQRNVLRIWWSSDGSNEGIILSNF